MLWDMTSLFTFSVSIEAKQKKKRKKNHAYSDQQFPLAVKIGNGWENWTYFDMYKPIWGSSHFTAVWWTKRHCWLFKDVQQIQIRLFVPFFEPSGQSGLYPCWFVFLRVNPHCPIEVGQTKINFIVNYASWVSTSQGRTNEPDWWQNNCITTLHLLQDVIARE